MQLSFYDALIEQVGACIGGETALLVAGLRAMREWEHTLYGV
jgi:hypothetical protein